MTYTAPEFWPIYGLEDCEHLHRTTERVVALTGELIAQIQTCDDCGEVTR